MGCLSNSCQPFYHTNSGTENMKRLSGKVFKKDKHEKRRIFYVDEKVDRDYPSTRHCCPALPTPKYKNLTNRHKKRDTRDGYWHPNQPPNQFNCLQYTLVANKNILNYMGRTVGSEYIEYSIYSGWINVLFVAPHVISRQATSGRLTETDIFMKDFGSGKIYTRKLWQWSNIYQEASLMCWFLSP